MIEVKNVVKYYNDFKAVDNISFSVKQGEILALLGPNGAGKSSTIRMICCYLMPTKGDIEIKGISVKKASVDVKKMIGYLPESAPLYNDMMVYDYLYYISQIREIPKDTIAKKIAEMVSLCGLEEVMHKNIGDLSKGFRQRVGLANVMIADPEILVLDEPTSGLDPNQIVEIRKLIKEIGKKKTVILCTHILSEVEATCDRVLIINKGKVVADGTAQSLKNRSKSDKNLIIELTNIKEKDIEKVKEKLKSVKTVEEVSLQPNENKNEKTLKTKSYTFLIHYKSEKDKRQEFYKIIKNNDWNLLLFQQRRETLENVFRQLTSRNFNEQGE